MSMLTTFFACCIEPGCVRGEVVDTGVFSMLWEQADDERRGNHFYCWYSISNIACR